MTKDEFCDLMERAKAKDEKWQQLNDLLGDITALSEMTYIDEFIAALEAAFDGDPDAMISFWVWGLNWGSDYTPGDVSYSEEGVTRIVKLRTAENLYNYLTGNPDLENCNDG